MVAAEHGEPVVHLFSAGFVGPMLEERGGGVERESFASRMNFQGEADWAGSDEIQSSSDEFREPFWTKHRRQDATSAMLEVDGDFGKETQMVGKAKGAGG